MSTPRPHVTTPVPVVGDDAASAAYAELKARLIDTFNHELRTPLTTLICHAELLGSLDRLPEEARASLAAMGRATASLRQSLAAITDMLSTEPPMTREHAPVDLALLVRRLVSTLGWRPHPRGVSVHLAEAVEVKVLADATLLRRAVLELLDNALTHAPSGSQVRVGVTRDGGFASVTVTDEGPGMSAADRLTYMQATDDGTHFPQVGARLGLAIAGATAAAHLGELLLEDGPGGGLAASLRLPLSGGRPRALGGAQGRPPR